jgi:DNA primase
VLALDADAAGNRATLRGLEIARQTLDHETDLVFDARGLLKHEVRLQADIRVAVLPQDFDPDEVVNRNPEEWKQILDNARPIVIHVMETLAVGRDLDDPKAKDEIAMQVLPLIEDVASPVERETYRQRLARFLRVDERALVHTEVYSYRQHRGSSKVKVEPRDLRIISTPNKEREPYILGVLLREPALLFRIDRALQEEKLERIIQQDFQRADYQEIFNLIRLSLEQDEIEPYKYIQNKLSPLLLEVVDDLYARTDKLDPENERVLDDLIDTLLYLRRSNYQRQKEVLDSQITEAQELDNSEILSELKTRLYEILQILRKCDLAQRRFIHFG